MAQLDETLTDGQTGHVVFHETLHKKANYVFDVMDYGAKGDGTTDDTAALQAAIDAAGDGEVIIPEGNCLISSALTIAFANVGIRIHGATRASSTITQDTDDTAIFHFTESGTHSWRVSDLGLTWTNQQSSNTSARAFAFTVGGAQSAGSGHYRWTVERIDLANGYSGFSQTAAAATVNPVWGCTIRDVRVTSSWVGPIVSLNQSAAGQPDITVSKIRVEADNIPAASNLFAFTGAKNVLISEANVGNSALPVEVSITSCDNVQIVNYRTEGGTITTASSGIVNVSNSNVSISGLGVQSKTINLSSGWVFIIRCAGATSNISVTDVVTLGTTYTSGQMAVIQGPTATSWYLRTIESDATAVIYASDATGDATVYVTAGGIQIGADLNHDGTKVGFYGTAPVTQQTGVAVSAAGVHAALVNLGLITS